LRKWVDEPDWKHSAGSSKNFKTKKKALKSVKQLNKICFSKNIRILRWYKTKSNKYCTVHEYVPLTN